MTDRSGEPIIEILPKAAVGDLVRDTLVSGCNDPYIGGSQTAFAYTTELAPIEDPEEFHLREQRKVAQLVEEESARLPLFDQALAVVNCTRECATAVAKQLRFSDPVGDGAAVHSHERGSGPTAAEVQLTGNNLFTGAGFPCQQHGQFCRGHAIEPPRHRLHLLANGYEVPP